MSGKTILVRLVVIVALLAFGLSDAVPAFAAVTKRVSISSSGEEGNHISRDPAMTADGRFVAFLGYASNLVIGDTNGCYDAFVRDTLTGITERVSVSSSGEEGDAGGYAPSISADGRYVAFASDSTMLVSGDTGNRRDVFVHDRQIGVTERVSVSSEGTQANSDSWEQSISPDGRYVAFSSDASNLVPGDTNGKLDVFVHDRQTGVTERVSVSSTGEQANGYSGQGGMSISADGRCIVYDSDASSLVLGDTNGCRDMFLRDRQTGTTERVSVSYEGAQADNSSGYSTTVNCGSPSISADGRYVVFGSIATNLVPGGANGMNGIFIRDRQAGITERVSVSSSGVQGNHNSGYQSVSGDGRYVTFYSSASNLVAGDTNSREDVFRRDRAAGITERVSVRSDGGQGSGSSIHPAISADGRYVAFDWSAPQYLVHII